MSKDFSMTAVPLVIVGALEETYTLRGIEMWWTSRNAMLSGQVPQDVWPTNPDAVVAVATSLASRQ